MHRIAAHMEVADYDIPPQDGARLAWLYQHGEVVDRHDADAAVHVTVRLLPADRARFERPANELRPARSRRSRRCCCAMRRGRRSCRGSAIWAPATCARRPARSISSPKPTRRRNALIHAGLVRAFPSAVVVGEEATSADPQRLRLLADAELAFVVDPVDGTANFAAGLPLFGVMAAVIVRGEVVAAAIHDPVCDDTALALRGEGAWTEAADGRRATTARCAAGPIRPKWRATCRGVSCPNRSAASCAPIFRALAPAGTIAVRRTNTAWRAVANATSCSSTG